LKLGGGALFLSGFLLGLAIAFIIFITLPRIVAGHGVHGLIKAGHIDVDGLHADFYVNTTRKNGITYIDTVVVKYWWSYGLPGGSGIGYCKLAPLNITAP